MDFNYGLLVPLSFIFGTISWRFLIATVFLENFKEWPVEKLIMPFICIHLFRYISISLMIPGLTSIGEILPFNDVLRLTLFDVACSILSMLSLLFLHKKWKGAMIFPVLLNIVGLLDLLIATLYDVPQFVANVETLDARLFAVLTTFIPLIFVSHTFMVQLLWKYFRSKRQL